MTVTQHSTCRCFFIVAYNRILFLNSRCIGWLRNMLNWPTQRTRVYWKISILSTDNGGFPHVLWTSSNPFLWKLVSMGRYFGSCTVHCLSIGSMEPHLQAASVSCGASSCLPVAWLGQLSHWLLKDTKFFIFSALSQGVSKIFIFL